MRGLSLNVLGFSCSGKAELNFPTINEGEKKVLERYLDLYKSRGDVLDKLLEQAAKKGITFSEKSVRFWAPKLVEGRLGPLDVLLSLNLEEIMVNGVGLPIFVYDRNKGMLETNLRFEAEDYFLELVNRILAKFGRRVNRSNPRESGILENGDRISVVVPPYSRDMGLSIRKYLAEPFTVVDLVERKMLSYEDAALLWYLIENGSVNLGVVGNTGSGKTTLLNALLRFIPENQRLILVEDIPEIKPLQKQHVSLLENKALGISMRDAIIDSLRLRPDRVIIGEVRTNGDVEALRESCLAGHALGTYFTYHAESIDWAYRRLSHQGFPDYDLKSIPVMVGCRRFESKGKIVRKVVEIKANDVKVKDLDERVSFLKKCKGLSDKEFFEKIQRWYFE